jgi:hypothetical protein
MLGATATWQEPGEAASVLGPAEKRRPQAWRIAAQFQVPNSFLPSLDLGYKKEKNIF